MVSQELISYLVGCLQDAQPETQINVTIDYDANNLSIECFNISSQWAEVLENMAQRHKMHQKPPNEKWQCVKIPPWKMSRDEVDELTNDLNKKFIENAKSPLRCDLHKVQARAKLPQ